MERNRERKVFWIVVPVLIVLLLYPMISGKGFA